MKVSPFPLLWLRVATFITTCLHNLTSHLTHLDPEDGGYVFLQNVGIQLQNYTALQPRGSQFEWPLLVPLVSTLHYIRKRRLLMGIPQIILYILACKMNINIRDISM